MRGAEAVLRKGTLLGRNVVIKERVKKSYRAAALDKKLRIERTRNEARLLHKAKLAGVSCPTVLEIDEFEITMDRIAGKRPEMNKKNAAECGKILAKLHAADIIHGDYTPANIMQNGNEMYVIDFGLGFISQDIEDKAVDVFTMLRSISDEKIRNVFLDGYKSIAKDKAETVFTRVNQVEKRVRYAN